MISMTASLKLGFSTALQAILDELKQLKAEGVEVVHLEDSTLSGLRTAVEAMESKDSSEPLAESPACTSAAPPAEQPMPPAGRLVQTEAVETPATPSDVEARGNLVPPVVDLPEGNKKGQWEWLREKVLSCETCTANRNPDRQIVFGVGNLDADIFFCGEAPGEEEELQGEPFVGPAGQKLNGIIRGMGLSREDVYIGNIMNWRPNTGIGSGNRPPSPLEMDFCFPYLRAQVSIVQPRVIVALGNTAIRAMLGHDQSLRVGRIHGNWYEFEGIPMMPTFHPSYILRNESMQTKRLVWEDLLAVMERLEMPISEKQQNFFL